MVWIVLSTPIWAVGITFGALGYSCLVQSFRYPKESPLSSEALLLVGMGCFLGCAALLAIAAKLVS